MRKIVAGLFISLDGVTESPDQWHFPYFNDEMGKAVDANLERSDALLLGRVTYEAFASYWPDKTGADEDFADLHQQRAQVRRLEHGARPRLAVHDRDLG